MPPATIWWIRRDLRLHDNPALQAALQDNRVVIPVFILDPYLLQKPAANRREFLFDGLRALDADLRQHGSHLILREGNPLAALGRLVAENGAGTIYAAQDFSPYADRRDEAVSSILPLQLTAGVTIHPPSAVRKADGNPYTVFTPYRKAWQALPFPSAGNDDLPAIFPALPPISSLPLPQATSNRASHFPAGEAEATRRLQSFLNGPIDHYASQRNRLDLEGTSVLSPYLRFGMLSPRRAAQAALDTIQSAMDEESRLGAQTWLNELIWRDFYIHILDTFPEVLRTAFNPALRRIQWREASDELHAWQEGMTGYPVVDAAMRQLRQTGWIHNRARMIVASFLVKNLLINWQEGERWFMRSLLDGDPAANNGGWQWTAGVGTDAAPYFRIFNPILQGKKFDPQGEYIRRWLPELDKVPIEYIHTPWEMPIAIQDVAGCRISRDYPAPIVDITKTKDRTLAAFRDAKTQTTFPLS